MKPFKSTASRTSRQGFNVSHQRLSTVENSKEVNKQLTIKSRHTETRKGLASGQNSHAEEENQHILR